jgi:pimeloyl-ACP methyl ester carboxylesterase
MTQPRSVYVRTGDGITLHTREMGSGNTACLLIHGFADGEYVWHDLSVETAALCRTITVDLRGHGRSSWSDSATYTLGAHLSDILHVIVAAQVRRIVVVGHSLGGQIALEMAASYPALIVGIVVVDFAPEQNEIGTQQLLTNLKLSLRNYSSIADYAAWLEATRPLTPRHLLSRIATESLREAPDGGFILRLDPRLADLPDDPRKHSAGAWNRLKMVQCPVLLVRGHASAVLRSTVANQMLVALNRSRLAVIPEAGHAVPTDNPAELARVVRPFCAQLLEGLHDDPAPRAIPKIRTRCIPP